MMDHLEVTPRGDRLVGSVLHIPSDPSTSTPRAICSRRDRHLAIVALLCTILIFVVPQMAPVALHLRSNRLLGADYDVQSDDNDNASLQSFIDNRPNCQIIYVLGVEGSVHHGFTPILEKLAREQVDPEGNPYDVAYSEGRFRAALFGFHREERQIDDPTLIRRTLRLNCPNDGRRHVILEDASFPSGAIDDPRSYRVHRQERWLHASVEEIAGSEEAMNHPTNLYKFYEAYAPYADVKFVVLHRSFIETIASHPDLDGSVEQHSNVIRGFMLLLRRFLDAHPFDKVTGQKLWTVVCINQLMARYSDDQQTNEAQMASTRQAIVSNLAYFLGWNRMECANCFDHWRESKKNHLQILGEENAAMVSEHMREMDGIWPPVAEDAPPEQWCSL